MRRLNYLNRYFLKYKKYLLPGILFTVLSNFFTVYPAKIVGYALDLIVETLTVYRSAGGFSFRDSYYNFTLQAVAVLAGMYLLLTKKGPLFLAG